MMAAPATSDVTARAVAFVAAHRDPAEELGASLADLSNDPDAFAKALTRGLAALADPEYLAGQQRIAPGIGPVHGVRWPLLAAVSRGFRNPTRGDRPTPLLFIADRLYHERELEARWFAFGLLERTLDGETERTWQLLRRAARQAGGWIEVQSSRGNGSQFEVWLPLTDAEAMDAAAPQAAAGAERGQETLLVVEDQPDVRRMSLSILKASGYRLLETGNAEQALALSANYSGKIDLLVTDVIMPGLNGRQLADRLVEERPGLKVLYTSGYTADVIALHGSLEPGMEYLPKPFGAAQLSAKVREVLASGKPQSRILVIDDDSAVRAFLGQILNDAGYLVVEAGDGRSGMSKLEQMTVDLVITDLVMPEQEGLETLQRLHVERPELPVIAISGAFGGSFLKAARRLGATASLSKPIDPEELLRAVSNVLSRR